MAWSAGLVAFVAAVPLGRHPTNAITITHEGGHAVFGWLFGSAVKHVKIFREGSGEMRPGPENYLSTFASLVAGQLVFAHIWVWFPLMGGAQQVPELFWTIHSGDTTNDAALLLRHAG